MTTPPSFDILSRTTPIFCNRLIEASAGTGKTFTMEHLIVRLLLEEPTPSIPPCTLQEILTVTFTRAAVRDMQRRLHQNLERTLLLLNQTDQTKTTELPDYLQAIIEKGERAQLEAARKIESALAVFEESSIYTLHGFCAHTLSKHPKYALQRFSEEPLSEQIHRTVRHFFRTELDAAYCHPAQLQKVLGLFRGSVEELEKALIRMLASGASIQATYSFSDSFERFQQGMHLVKAQGPFEKEKILKDWETRLPRYKQLNSKPASDYTESVHTLAELLEQDVFSLEDWATVLVAGLPLAQCQEKQRLKPLPEGACFYPELPSLLQTHLLPLLDETMHPERIFSWIAHGCQRLWKRYLRLEGGGGPDRLIEQTVEALEDPQFVKDLRKHYRIVLVDEFQDTDPLQWHLLQSLFLHHLPLVLVGDPKQSIYAFRNADLYTYYKAAAHFGAGSTTSLSVNYRSDGPLVAALNALFCHEHTPALFDLPKLNTFIPYPPVQAAPTRQQSSLPNASAIQFLLYKGVKGRKKNWPTEDIEREVFLPECVKEMIALHTDSNICFSEMALLVRDRHQAAYAYEVLEKAGIPACIHRRHSILNSEAWVTWTQWMEAMLFPEETSLRHQALVGLFLRCSQEDLALKTDEMEAHLRHMAYLRELLQTQGLAAHAEALFFTPCKEGKQSLFAYLMQTPSLRKIAQELEHILELLLRHQTETCCDLYGLFAFLCSNPKRLLYDEELYQSRLSSHEEAVSIVTMHKSKGLEFDIVFSLGTAKRGDHREHLLHDTNEETAVLRPYSEEEPLYHALCLERDAEKIRHAYVAMTRAKKRLYITYAIATDGASLESGEASPLDLLFARLNHPQATLNELYPRLNSWQGESLCQWIDTHPELSISYRFLEPSLALAHYQGTPSVLVAPAPIQFSLQPFFTLSYSHCVEKKEYSHSKPILNELLLDSSPLQLSDSKEYCALPEGKETGLFLHHILATLPWQRLALANSKEDVVPWLKSYIKTTQWEPWLDTIAALLYRTWHTPLALLPGGGTLKLADIDPALQSREMEFLYDEERLPDHMHWTGSIDLLFSHEGLYYLIDWKSHQFTLEEQESGQAALKQKIADHGLLLQAAIYTKALKRYLKQIEPRPFSECFGGFAFLFLRALSPLSSEKGVIVYSHEALEQIDIPLQISMAKNRLWSSTC